MPEIEIRESAALVALAFIAACRIHFDAAGGPASDATGDAPINGACTPVPSGAACNSGTWSEAAFQPFGELTSRAPSEATEWAAEISCDGLDLVFSGNSAVGSDNTGTFRLYTTRRRQLTDPFSTPELLTFDTLGDGLDPSIANDELYFVSDVDLDHLGNPTPCLFVSTRSGTAWGTPVLIGAWACSATLGGPYVSRDGQRLYYNQDLAGVRTLVMALRSPSGYFDTQGTPVRWTSPGAGAGLGYCTLTPDELTVYCETSGPPTQLVQATRASRTASFNAPEPVPGLAELPATDDDGDPSITADGKLLVYASTRGRLNPNSGRQHLHLAERVCQ